MLSYLYDNIAIFVWHYNVKFVISIWQYCHIHMSTSLSLTSCSLLLLWSRYYIEIRQRLPTPCNGAVITAALRGGGGYIVVFATAGTLYKILLQLFTSWHFIKCTYNMLRWWIKERSFRQLKLLGFRSRILQSTKNMFVLWLKILPTAFNSKINIFIRTFLGGMLWPQPYTGRGGCIWCSLWLP